MKYIGRIRRVRIHKQSRGERFVDVNGHTFYLLVIRIGKRRAIHYYETFWDAPQLQHLEGQMATIDGDEDGSNIIMKTLTQEDGTVLFL